MQVCRLPEAICQIDPNGVAGADPQRRANVIALKRVALDLGAGYGEGSRLDHERSAQLPICRPQLNRRLEGETLFCLEGRRYALRGGGGRGWNERWASRTGGARLWECGGWATSDGQRDDHDD